MPRWFDVGLRCSGAPLLAPARCLLDKVASGTDGPSPSMNEVLKEDRHAGPDSLPVTQLDVSLSVRSSPPQKKLKP